MYIENGSCRSIFYTFLKLYSRSKCIFMNVSRQPSSTIKITSVAKDKMKMIVYLLWHHIQASLRNIWLHFPCSSWTKLFPGTGLLRPWGGHSCEFGGLCLWPSNDALLLHNIWNHYKVTGHVRPFPRTLNAHHSCGVWSVGNLDPSRKPGGWAKSVLWKASSWI